TRSTRDWSSDVCSSDLPGGEPLGILIDNAADLVASRVPGATRSEKIAAVRAAIAECAVAGLTGVHEPGLAAEEVDILHELGAKRSEERRVGKGGAGQRG